MNSEKCWDCKHGKHKSGCQLHDTSGAKEYAFEVDVNLGILSVSADNEKEARENLLDMVKDYFRETEKDISRGEATLISIDGDPVKNCGNCSRPATVTIGDINRCDRCKDL